MFAASSTDTGVANFDTVGALVDFLAVELFGGSHLLLVSVTDSNALFVRHGETSIALVLYAVKRHYCVHAVRCGTLGAMVELASMPRFPRVIPEDELYEILTATKGDKVPVSYRLTPEAIRVIEEAAERYSVDKTKALEIIIRETREQWKRKK